MQNYQGFHLRPVTAITRDIDKIFQKKRKYWCLDFMDCLCFMRPLREDSVLPSNFKIINQ